MSWHPLPGRNISSQKDRATKDGQVTLQVSQLVRGRPMHSKSLANMRLKNKGKGVFYQHKRNVEECRGNSLALSDERYH